MNNFDTTEYNQRFQAKVADTVRAGPVESEDRSCHDVPCLFIFAILIILTLVFGGIMITDGRAVYDIAFKDHQASGISAIGETFSRFAGVIVGMFILAFLLSVIFLLLIKNFTKCMVWSMIALTFIVLIALAILSVVTKIWYLLIICLVAILALGCMVWCCRDRIKIGIKLLEVAANFITEKPTVYIAPLYPLFFAIIFFVFWFAALISGSFARQQALNENKSTTKYDAFITVYVFIFIFMTYFFYYVQTFLISSACASWYYGLNINYFTTGAYRVNRFHLGSLTFAAMLVAIVNLLKRLVQDQAEGEDNGVLSCIFCILACCLSCIEGLLQVLNHNTVIVMAVTGQSYISCAKSAISLIFQNFAVFYVVDFISDLVNLFGMVLCVGIPSALGLVVVKYGQNGTDSEVIYTTIIIVFLSMMIVSLVFSMLGEALSCVFIYYCFDRKFRSMGISVANSPAIIRQIQQAGRDDEQPPATSQQLKNRY